jgi:hypothetical protein
MIEPHTQEVTSRLRRSIGEAVRQQTFSSALTQPIDSVRLSESRHQSVLSIASYYYWNRVVDGFIRPQIMGIMRAKKPSTPRMISLQALLPVLRQSYLPDEATRDDVDEHVAGGFAEALKAVETFRQKNPDEDTSDDSPPLDPEQDREQWRMRKQLCSNIVNIFISAIQDWKEEEEARSDKVSSWLTAQSESDTEPPPQSRVSGYPDTESTHYTQYTQKDRVYSEKRSFGLEGSISMSLSDSQSVQEVRETSILSSIMKTIGNCLSR